MVKTDIIIISSNATFSHHAWYTFLYLKNCSHFVYWLIQFYIDIWAKIPKTCAL